MKGLGGVLRTRYLRTLAGPSARTAGCFTAAAERWYTQRATYAVAATTLPLLKDIRKGDRGESRRLSFQERSERRMGKTREQKESKEQLLQEAEMLVNDDFPAELEAIYEKVERKANSSALRVLNMAKYIELLEVEVSGGRSVLLTTLAQVVKVQSNIIEVVPSSATFATPILQRVSSFDSSLQVSKEGQKIKVVMLPIDTAKRDRAVHEIKSLSSTLQKRVKQSRINSGKVLQDCGLEENLIAELVQAIDSTASLFLEEKNAELELLAEEVMSMGTDESDATVSS